MAKKKPKQTPEEPQTKQDVLALEESGDPDALHRWLMAEESGLGLAYGKLQFAIEVIEDDLPDSTDVEEIRNDIELAMEAIRCTWIEEAKKEL